MPWSKIRRSGTLMAGSVLISLAFFHYGEVLFWHKQVVFWSTVVVIMYFMFNEPKQANLKTPCPCPS